jgi:hypothetical protein
MTAFRDHPDEWQRLDWRLLLHGPVTLYCRAAVLVEHVAWFQSNSYRIDELDCTRWQSAREFHEDVARVLGFPDYYGKNLNALSDCMSDIEVPEQGGRVIIWRRYDAFAARDPQAAQGILDTVALSTWRFLLVGRRLLSLVQSDDPRLMFDPVGSHPVSWNPQEWLNAKRRA